MGRFVLEIDTDSDYFHNVAGFHLPVDEVINSGLAKILSKIAEENWLLDLEHEIRDGNGTPVGFHQYEREEK